MTKANKCAEILEQIERQLKIYKELNVAYEIIITKLMGIELDIQCIREDIK